MLVCVVLSCVMLCRVVSCGFGSKQNKRNSIVSYCIMSYHVMSYHVLYYAELLPSILITSYKIRIVLYFVVFYLIKSYQLFVCCCRYPFFSLNFKKDRLSSRCIVFHPKSIQSNVYLLLMYNQNNVY